MKPLFIRFSFLLNLVFFVACSQTNDSTETIGESAPTTSPALAPTEVRTKLEIDLNRFEKSIAAYEAADATNPIAKGEVLFTGSSSIYFWKSLKEDMAGMPVHNRGFGGSTLPEVIHYADRVVFPYEPKIIMLYCGENDIAMGATAMEAFNSYKEFATMVEQKLPETQLTFLAMKPSVARWKLWPEYQKANRLIKTYIDQREKMDYLAVDESMLDAKGMVDSTIFVKDMLHMNAEGYKRWTAIANPYLRKLLH